MMFGRRGWAASLIGLLILSHDLPGRAQQIAGSVEGGLQTLAQEIVAKSVATDLDVVAVVPFPSADGTCSVLSTYLVDELIQALFSVQGSSLKIVERTQLEALIREVQIGEGGLLNPATTQKLGNISGVKALTVGTITEIGDRVRINARLVATDTGRTVSAAAVTVPRTGDIDGLLRRPIASGNGLCGEAGKGAGWSARPRGDIPRPPPTASQQGEATLEGVSFLVRSATRDTNSGMVSVLMEVSNTQSAPLRALVVAPAPTVIDDIAELLEAETVSGIASCELPRRPFVDVRYCARGPRSYWTVLEPGLARTVLMRFSGSGSHGTTLTLAATLVVERVEEDNGQGNARRTQASRSQASTIRQLSLSLPNLPIRAAGR